MYPKVAQALVRRDEGTVNIAVLNESLSVGNAGDFRVSYGMRYTGLGNRDDQVGVDRGLLGQQVAHSLASHIDIASVDVAIRTGKVDEFKDAHGLAFWLDDLDGLHTRFAKS